MLEGPYMDGNYGNELEGPNIKANYGNVRGFRILTVTTVIREGLNIEANYNNHMEYPNKEVNHHDEYEGFNIKATTVSR